MNYRENISDNTYFLGFEKLYSLSDVISRQHGACAMPESYLKSFRKEEAKVVRFLLNQQNDEATPLNKNDGSSNTAE
jgi:phosphoribosylformylglycinamidine (FGAM) synthase-like amidotransferase family enzyme